MKIKRKIKSIFFIIYLISFLILNTKGIQAQEGANITYSPVVEYLSLDPGSNYSGSIKITNMGNNYMNYEVNILPFTSFPDKPGVPRPMSAEKAETYAYNASKWFGITVKNLSLDPLSVSDFNYTITVPKDASPGGYYVGIFFKDASISIEDKNVEATLIGGPIFLIKVSGNVVEGIDVLEFKTNKYFYEYNPVDFITTIQNTGNVHVVPRGDIEVMNMCGDKVATLSFNKEKYNILRDTTNIFENKWDEGDNLLSKLINKDKKILFGRMKAKLVVLYRSENPGYDYKTAYTTFWIIPWKLILILLIIIIICIILIRRKRKQRGTGKYIKE